MLGFLLDYVILRTRFPLLYRFQEDVELALCTVRICALLLGPRHAIRTPWWPSQERDRVAFAGWQISSCGFVTATAGCTHVHEFLPEIFQPFSLTWPLV